MPSLLLKRGIGEPWGFHYPFSYALGEWREKGGKGGWEWVEEMDPWCVVVLWADSKDGEKVFIVLSVSFRA